MSTDKEIKRMAKNVDKQIKRFRKGLGYLGIVDNLCNIYKHVKNPVAGNLVYVRNGAVHFIEDPEGSYVRINKKYVNVKDKGYTGKIPEKAVRYSRLQDFNVMYIHTGTAWVKC